MTMTNVYSLPALDPPRPDDITAALKLIMALGDAKGTAATLKRLAEATAAHMAAASEAEAKLAEVDRRETSLQSRLDAEASDMARARAEHEKRLAARERECDERLKAREVDLAGREKAVVGADKKYLQLSADLERRLQLVRAAGSSLMPHDPKRELSPTEAKVFGPGAKIHPITGEVIEQGSGAHPPDVQAALVHVLEIERREGKAVADEVRRKLSMASRPLAADKKD